MRVWLKGEHTKTDVTTFFVNFLMHGPKQYLNGQIQWLSIPNTLNETKIGNLHNKARRQESPSLLYESAAPAPWRRLLVILRLALLDMHKDKLFIEGACGKNPSRLLMLFGANPCFFFSSLSKHWEVYIQKENPIELTWAFFSRYPLSCLQCRQRF